MKEFLKITSILTIVCVICAFLLSLTFGLAKEKIAFNSRKTIENAIAKLAPWAMRVEMLSLDDNVVYNLFDGKNILKGYALIAEGDGYQGKIKILAILNVTLTQIEGIEIIQSVETPGLGARIGDDFFKNQFKQLKILPQIECIKADTKKENQIVAISGATVSSRAVVNILNRHIVEIKKEINKNE